MNENGLTEYGQVGAPAGTGLSDRRFPKEDNLVGFIREWIFDEESGWHSMDHPEDNTLCDKCEVELPDGTAMSYMPRIAVIVPGLVFIDTPANKSIVEFASGTGGELLGMIIRFACTRWWVEIMRYRHSGRGDAASALVSNNHLEYQDTLVAWKVKDDVYGDGFRRLAKAMHESAKMYARRSPYRPWSRYAAFS